MSFEKAAALSSCVSATMVNCCWLPCSVPTGVFWLAAATAAWIWAIEMPRAASATASSWILTANCWLPKIETCATPFSVDSDGEITCWANASRSVSGTMSLFSASSRIGASAGLTLR